MLKRDTEEAIFEATSYCVDKIIVVQTLKTKEI